jgi:hypothetical protein
VVVELGGEASIKMTLRPAERAPRPLTSLASRGRPLPQDGERRSAHDHLGAGLDAVVELDDVDVAHADAARGRGLADLLRLVRAVDCG